MAQMGIAGTACTPIKYLIVLSDFQIFRKTVLDKYFFART